MNYTVLQQCEIARRDPQLSDTHKGTFKHAVWAAADCWLPSDVTRGNSRGGGTATPLLPNAHPPSLTYHQINENTEGSQEFPHNSSVTLWTTMKDNPCRSSCLWWECVCLCPVRVSVYAQQQDITQCLCQNPNNGHQPGRQAQLDTKTQHRNFNCVTYQVWSSSKRRYVERRGGQGWRKNNNKLDRGRMRRTREARVCLPRLPCFSLVLNFDRLCLLLESVSLLSFGQGRRDDTPSLGKGAGVRVFLRAARGEKEGWSWLGVINIH